MGKNTMVPVRWLPPESLLFRKFTTESDMWAFGVLLWEIFTYGCVPWYQYSNYEVMEVVKAGKILEKPEKCPDEVFHRLLLPCWSLDARDRPTATTARQALESIIDSSSLYCLLIDPAENTAGPPSGGGPSSAADQQISAAHDNDNHNNRQKSFRLHHQQPPPAVSNSLRPEHIHQLTTSERGGTQTETITAAHKENERKESGTSINSNCEPPSEGGEVVGGGGCGGDRCDKQQKDSVGSTFTRQMSFLHRNRKSKRRKFSLQLSKMIKFHQQKPSFEEENAEKEQKGSNDGGAAAAAAVEKEPSLSRVQFGDGDDCEGDSPHDSADDIHMQKYSPKSTKYRQRREILAVELPNQRLTKGSRASSDNNRPVNLEKRRSSAWAVSLGRFQAAHRMRSDSSNKDNRRRNTLTAFTDIIDFRPAIFGGSPGGGGSSHHRTTNTGASRLTAIRDETASNNSFDNDPVTLPPSQGFLESTMSQTERNRWIPDSAHDRMISLAAKTRLPSTADNLSDELVEKSTNPPTCPTFSSSPYSSSHHSDGKSENNAPVQNNKEMVQEQEDVGKNWRTAGRRKDRNDSVDDSQLKQNKSGGAVNHPSRRSSNNVVVVVEDQIDEDQSVNSHYHSPKFSVFGVPLNV